MAIPHLNLNQNKRSRIMDMNYENRSLDEDNNERGLCIECGRFDCSKCLDCGYCDCSGGDDCEAIDEDLVCAICDDYTCPGANGGSCQHLHAWGENRFKVTEMNLMES